MTARAFAARPWEVRAYLDGRLSQIRRVVWPRPRDWTTTDDGAMWPAVERKGLCALAVSPFGEPGDELWWRETWRPADYGTSRGQIQPVFYCADGERRDVRYECKPYAYTPDRMERWRSSATMPRWASRITTRVVSVRVERAQDISDGDAIACGCYRGRPCASGGVSWVAEYAEQFDRDNAARGGTFGANPWVWCAEVARKEGGAR